MTTAAIRSPSIRTVGPLGCWLSVRHSLRRARRRSPRLDESPAAEVLLAGAEGATFLALVSRD